MDQQQSILTTNSTASQETTASATAPASPVASTPSVNETVSPAPVVAQNATTSTANTEVQTSNWLDNLPAEVKEVKALQNFKSVEELAKSYANLNSLLGKRFNDLSPEEVEVFNSKLGRPADKSQYVLPDELNQDAATWLKDTAYSLGLKQDQAKKIADDLVLINRAEKDKAIAARNQMLSQATEVLQKEFGAAYDARLNVARKAVENFGGESVKKLLNDTGLGNHPDVIKMFANIGKNLLEDRILTSETQQTFKTTPAEARFRLTELTKSKEFVNALVNPNLPNHAEVKKQYNELQDAAYGI